MLSDAQKHFLRLARKGQDEKGWAPISAVVMRNMAQVVPPDDLLKVEELSDGRGRCRLTDRGNAVLDYL